jgi:hypothetical protein
MGMENHCCRDGRLINVLVTIVATRYNPTYKNRPDDACIVGFLFCGKSKGPLSINA